MSNERKMCDLKPFRDEWRLTVKLLHSWKQTTSYGGDTLECVLGDKIQASCKRSQMNRVQRVGQYRPTTQQYKMTIIGDTSITPSDYRNDNHFLNLANYEEIANGKLKPHFLIDIMGQVTKHGAVAMVQAKGNDTKRVHFRLRDTSGHEVACCLWGKYAAQFETVKEANDENIICLIRFAKISEYRGEKQITNAFDASLVFLNPTMEEALDFRQKMLNDPLPLAILDQSNENKIITKVAQDWDEVDVRCISEILQSFEADSWKIICLIESIDTNWGWFYFGCKRHNLRLTRIGRKSSGKMIQSEKPQFHFEICRGACLNIEPKFKLHLVVKDDTETCILMLLDTVAKTIIGSKAVELWNVSFNEIEDPEVIPQPIRDLVGKSFCFGLAITNDNVNGSETFKVSELLTIDHINENSSGDVSTPSNKRKEDECDQMDMTSTSKKLCTNIIKKEKTKTD
ncbi:hypothetical protein F2Q68_00006681 [Brassica cretica]|uniref:DUF223 domain-containing protein n=1 Tax=Brassica cretica TaxID=69181 RepID=A0A8S9JLK6_BRACR|nr:hypothetical protein F2Q68_00006681 [Brassica cretica]